MPEKLTTSPLFPPEICSADQSQSPVHAFLPQLTANCIASLSTLRLVVAPTKFTSERITPVPGVPSVSGYDWSKSMPNCRRPVPVLPCVFVCMRESMCVM